MVASACGGYDPSASGNEASGSSKSPLLYGSQSVVDNAQVESEVVLAVQNGHVTAAFNDDSNNAFKCTCCPFVCAPWNRIDYTDTSRTVYAGASLMGYSYSDDSGATWTHGTKLTPPTGWSILWGDPAIASNTVYSQNHVWMSNLAVPTSKMPGSGYIVGGLEAYLGGACIAHSTDAGHTFVVQQCVNNNYDFYDGGSMAVTSNGRIYAAFVDVTTNKIDVWYAPSPTGAFVKIADPFPTGGDIKSHPRLRALGTDVYVMAENAGYQVGIAKTSSATTWGTAALVTTTNIGAIYPTATFANDAWGHTLKMRAGPQFSFDVGNTDRPIRAAVTKWDGSKYYVQGIGCTASLDCEEPWQWSTLQFQTPGDNFNPVVAAYPGFAFAPAQFVMQYHSRVWDPNGRTVVKAVSRLGRVGTTYDTLNYAFAAASQTVCPDHRNYDSGGGYWGDYDDVKFLGSNQYGYTFISAVTDSSDGCELRQAFTSRYQNVSSRIFNY